GHKRGRVQDERENEKPHRGTAEWLTPANPRAESQDEGKHVQNLGVVERAELIEEDFEVDFLLRQDFGPSDAGGLQVCGIRGGCVFALLSDIAIVEDLLVEACRVALGIRS